jgi:phosphoribosyl-ATP pyrophosphohydrolase
MPKKNIYNVNLFRGEFDMSNKVASELNALMDNFISAYGQQQDQNINSSVRLLELRLKLIKEEYKELTGALEAACADVFAKGNVRLEDQAAILKEACDLVYVIIGLCRAYGWDFDAAFAEVHRSNMSKLGADGKPIYREDGKVLKGPNYSPANVQPCL